MPQETVEQFYTAISKDSTLNFGTIEQFKNAMTDEERRGKLYDLLASKRGLKLGDRDSFISKMNPVDDPGFIERIFGGMFKERTPEQLEATRYVREKTTAAFDEQKTDAIDNPELFKQAVATATGGREPGILGEFVVGAMSGATGGLVSQPVTEGFPEEFARGAGEFGGFIVGGPMQLGKAATAKFLASSAGKRMLKFAGKRLGKNAPKYIQEALALGTASAVAGNENIVDILSDPSFGKITDEIFERAESFTLGAAVGARFGIIRDKIPGFARRAALNLAISNITHLGLSGIKGEEIQTSQIVFNSLLDVFFSKNGRMPKRKERAQLQDYAKEVAEKSGLEQYKERVISAEGKDVTERAAAIKEQLDRGEVPTRKQFEEFQVVESAMNNLKAKGYDKEAERLAEADIIIKDLESIAEEINAQDKANIAKLVDRIKPIEEQLKALPEANRFEVATEQVKNEIKNLVNEINIIAKQAELEARLTERKALPTGRTTIQPLEPGRVTRKVTEQPAGVEKEQKAKPVPAEKMGKPVDATTANLIVEDVKAGNVDKQGLQQVSKDPATAEKLEKKLRSEFEKAENGSKQQADLALAIDIVTQATGKKPQEPAKPAKPTKAEAVPEGKQSMTFAGVQDLPVEGGKAGSIQVKRADGGNEVYDPEKHFLPKEEQVKLDQAVKDYKGEALTDPEVIKRLEEPEKPVKEKPKSTTVEEFEKELKEIQRKPKVKDGDIVNTPDFGKVRVVDSSDPSMVKVETEQGNEFVIGRKALEEHPIEKTVDNETNTMTTASGEKVDLVPQPKKGSQLFIGKKSKQALDFAFSLFGKNKEDRQALKDVINSDPTAQRVDEMFDRARVESDRKHHKSLKGIAKILGRAFIDTSGNIKKALEKTGEAGRHVIMKHGLTAGATAKATHEFNRVSKELYGDLTAVEKDYLDRIIQSFRSIAIDNFKTGHKHPDAFTGSEFQRLIDVLPEPVRNKLNARADIYFNEMRNQLKQLYDAGIINKESYDAMLARGDYSPRRFLQFVDPNIEYRFGTKIRTVTSSGLKPLKEGDYGLMELNSDLLLSNVISRTQSRIFANEANKALHDFAQNNPDNGIVRLARLQKVTKSGKPIYESAGSREQKVKVMIDGQAKDMIMPTEFAKDWVPADPLISETIAQSLRIGSGSFILKPMATGLNPEFAVTNLPRDIAHIWLTTTEYNPFAPVAAGQMAVDFVKVLPSATGFHPVKGFKEVLSGSDWKGIVDATFKRDGVYLDYINQGGGMSFLTHQGQIGKPGTFKSGVKGKLNALQSIMGYLGETSEVLARLALRERAIKNGKSPEEATWIARDYLDFAQGGNVAKALDTGIPYLNASIQGTRGIFRAAKRDPAIFTTKVAQIAGLATGLYLANYFTNKEAMDQVSATDKRNNFVITTPMYYRDKQGNKRHIYFKIAKDQGQRVITQIFETIAAKSVGDPNADIDQVTKTAQDLIVGIVPEQNLPPSLDALIGYSVNKNFWRNEDIWERGYNRDVAPEEEYTAKTPKPYVEFGKFTGMSPERSQYAFEQIFTQGNVFTSLTGAGFNKLYSELPEAQKEEFTKQFLDSPFVRRFANETHPSNRTANKLEQQKIESNTERWKATRELNNLVDKYIAGSGSFEDVKSFIYEQEFEEQKRLANRVERSLEMRNVPNRGYWLDLAELPPEARAHSFYAEWKGATGEFKEQLENYYDVVPGVYSDTFARTLRALSRKNNDKKDWLRRRARRRSRSEQIIVRPQRRSRR